MAFVYTSSIDLLDISDMKFPYHAIIIDDFILEREFLILPILKFLSTILILYIFIKLFPPIIFLFTTQKGSIVALKF